MSTGQYFLWNVSNQSIYEVGEGIVLGRSLTCHYQIDSSDASRQHYRLFVKDGALYVTELGATNLTYIDCLSVEKKSTIKVNSFSVISVGKVHLIPFTMDDIRFMDKEGFIEKLSSELIEEVRSEIGSKCLPFFRYYVPEIKLIVKRRSEEIRLNKIDAEKSKEMVVVDKKKDELDEEYNRIMSEFKKKYSLIDVERAEVEEKFKPKVDAVQGIIDEIQAEIDKHPKDAFVPREDKVAVDNGED